MADPDVQEASADVETSEGTGRPTPPSRGPRPLTWAGIPRRRIVLVAAIAVLVGGGFVAVRETPLPATDAGAQRSHMADVASPVETGAAQTERQRLAVAQALLDHRAAAIGRRDLHAFLASLDPKATEFGDAQAEMFDSLGAVPYDRWTYLVERIGPFDLSEPRRRELGPTAFTASVSVHYRIKGYDDGDARFGTYLTFVQRGRGWYIAGDADGAQRGHRTQRQLWDLGKVAVVHGERSIVLGLGGRLQRHAADADEAVLRVTGVWGEDWEQKVVVVAPDTQEQMAELLGGDEARYAQIAAISRAESPSTESRVADRIVINPAIWPRLDSHGRRIVMTHEVTHIATRVPTDGGVPAWLSEGFADYVGFVGTGMAAPAVAPELLQAVREDGPRAALPADEDFQSGSGSLAQAYQAAWLACTLIAEVHGQDGLVAFYRAVRSGGGSAQDNVDNALREVLATTTDEFTHAWRSYVDELAQ